MEHPQLESGLGGLSRKFVEELVKIREFWGFLNLYIWYKNVSTYMHSFIQIFTINIISFRKIIYRNFLENR